VQLMFIIGKIGEANMTDPQEGDIYRLAIRRVTVEYLLVRMTRATYWVRSFNSNGRIVADGNR